ncbi:hypothetical protein SARC_15878 [Sphaeroforma arctica JP610]|uniref:RSE1/DDB1/CPSF1 first beta-propeller domain-containing protein n=1 Tax=Sphaeroforma arctica JP610 TaxID=667725 RepID=A0A0L0F4S1_9EUKA|nr:hypothetical protein SARC_15878 [Sphaeroforma arctica JP610]KNC71581.1 hypothetical protein SARC_15878 [Sphaeroforma arctica JP610]|eukprot:XP_014145483.1 hypothetical protein SARC_15878 [Sphaeroforma arctica JP610]
MQHELSVIISKGSYLEVFTVGEDGLDAFLNVNIYGRIAILKLFRPLHEKKDLLLIVTENYQFCVVKYDEASKEIKTHATGDVRDRVGRPADAGILGLIDPLCRMIGLRMYNGVFKVIPVSKKGHFDTAYNVRLEEIGIIDIVFLHG